MFIVLCSLITYNEIEQQDKQWSTKHRVTGTSLKTGGELGCSERVKHTFFWKIYISFLSCGGCTFDWLTVLAVKTTTNWILILALLPYKLGMNSVITQINILIQINLIGFFLNVRKFSKYIVKSYVLHWSTVYLLSLRWDSSWHNRDNQYHISNSYKINRNQQYENIILTDKTTVNRKSIKDWKKMKIGTMSIPVNINKQITWYRMFRGAVMAMIVW